MDDTQHFCLRWNNYQSSITSAFENLRDDEDFVDVTLACDGRSIKAHRVVLSACSPYFRELLKSTPCKHPVIVLQDVNFLDLHSLVEFIYHGEVNVHQRSLSSFLKTAEVLRVSGLTQQQAEETHSQLAQIQNLANSAGGRTPVNHHPSVHEDSLFPRNTGSPPPGPPPTHISNQLFRRAAAASLRRDRNNSTPSGVDECTLKRQRPDNGMPSNNNSRDLHSASPQLTPADFSTIKHNNNNTPPLKDDKRNGPTGNGILAIDKESLTPSPRARSTDDVKSEPMELVCSNNNPVSDDHSNDSTGEHDANRSSSGECGKGSLSSVNDDEIENSIHPHQPPPYLMSPADSKLFSTPGSFNFSMAALTDPAALAGYNSQLQSAAEMAVSPQGGSTSLIGGVIVPGGNSNSNNNNHHHHHHSSHHHHHQQQAPQPPPHSQQQHHQHSASLLHSHHLHHHQSHPSHHESSPQHQVGGSQQQQPPSSSSTSASVSSSAVLQHLHHHSASPIDSPHHHPLQHHRRSLSPGGGLGGPSGSSITAANNNRLLLPLPLTACHRCDVCGKLLSTKLTLKRHKEQQHLQPLNNAVCNLCHKVFRTLNSLNNHKSIYHRRQKNHHSSYFHSSSLHHSLTNSNNNSSGGSVVGSRGSSAAELLLSPITQQQQHSPGGVVKPCMDFL